PLSQIRDIKPGGTESLSALSFLPRVESVCTSSGSGSNPIPEAMELEVSLLFSTLFSMKDARDTKSDGTESVYPFPFVIPAVLMRSVPMKLNTSEHKVNTKTEET
ncbi:hypothetical protein U1Q18_017601, partial [Sarracenia purpurea var. burkii]